MAEGEQCKELCVLIEGHARAIASSRADAQSGSADRSSRSFFSFGSKRFNGVMQRSMSRISWSLARPSPAAAASPPPLGSLTPQPRADSSFRFEGQGGALWSRDLRPGECFGEVSFFTEMPSLEVRSARDGGRGAV